MIKINSNSTLFIEHFNNPPHMHMKLTETKAVNEKSKTKLPKKCKTLSTKRNYKDILFYVFFLYLSFS